MAKVDYYIIVAIFVVFLIGLWYASIVPVPLPSNYYEKVYLPAIESTRSIADDEL